MRLPDALTSTTGRRELPATDERGWFRFQRLYDVARGRAAARPSDVRRLVREAAEDDAADGSGWLEIQVDPTAYAARFGGLTAFARARPGRRRATPQPRPASASASSSPPTGPGTRWTRARSPGWPRSTPAAGVVGFGLVQRRAPRATPRTSPAAFRIARAGRPAVGPARRRAARRRQRARPASTSCGADRIGHGVRAAEDPRLLAAARRRAASPARSARPPTSALGVYARARRRTAADAARRRRPGGAGRRRPAALRARGSPTSTRSAREVHGSTTSALAGAGPACRCAASRGAGRRRRRGCWPGIDAWLGDGLTRADAQRRAARPGPARADERRSPNGRRDPVADLAGQRRAARRCVAPPRLVSARVCLVEMRAPALPVAAREAGLLDQPGRRGLDQRRPRAGQRGASAGQRGGRGGVEHRVGEERPGAPGVVVGGVEHHALAAAQGRAPPPRTLGQRRPPADRDAERAGPARRSGPAPTEPAERAAGT